ncbi:3-phosphoshikimate 1-carboxyvinyltransferase [Candidatus Solincola tengchongensis]|uniref:3-phosphoshikimate 1-carboxyvinyltransferase n=1 Tax=Candidatus Solincola tengchongensis TaxID=2900693 RepID=UPI00257B6DE3|nr:3-phosphoshikimate 1-carboxyvinyltransferase [Candidatus Solincola tengchongensis]
MVISISGSRALRGELRVPPDKSISHRAAILGAMARGTTVAEPFLRSGDCLSTLRCLRQLGVEVDLKGDTLVVKGRGPEGWRAPEKTLDAGNSATTMRLLAGALSGRPFRSELTGDESLRRRPMGRIVRPLRLMGADIEALGEGERPPLVIRGGELRGIEHRMEMDSAQVKSALLLAGLQAEGETRVLGGRSSRDHTERMLLLMGADLSFEGEDVLVIRRSDLQPAEIDIPGDLSSASFLLAAAALVPGSRLTVRDVGLNPTRAGFLSVLNSMGALVLESAYREVCNEPRGDLEAGSASLRGVEVEGWRIPALIDEVPLLAVLGCRARGETVVRGAGELRVKESDRIAAVCGELRKMGASIEELPDGFVVHGPVNLRGANVDSHGDHRIAMSLAVAALCAEGETVISGWECVDISFPGFLDTLRYLTG